MLRVGTAMVDITPRAGTHLAGSGAGEHRPAESVLDPLHAKAVVLEAEERKLCFLALDVTIVTEEYTAQVREAASEQFGLEPEAVMVHATQTHTAPSLGYLMLDPDFPALPAEYEYVRGAERSWCDFAATRAIQAIGEASCTLQPVQVGVGSGLCDGLAFNRRGVRRDGTVCMPWPVGRKAQPLGPTQLRYMEGPTDPEVGMMCLRREDMQVAAMLLHFTCHPVNVFAARSPVVSADWPGSWAAGMQAECGAGCVPLVLNGCCGNINPWDPFDPDFVPDHRRMGAALAEMTRKVMCTLEFTDEVSLDRRVRRVPLPLKTVEPEALAEAEKMLSDHPQPKFLEDEPGRVDPAWFRAASVMSIEYMRRRSTDLPYEIQAFRVGDTAFVGLPGEPFVEGQLAIKIGSPTYPTYVAHCTSQYVGYLPTRDAHQRGGHEVNTCYWAKLVPEALDIVTKNAIEMLEEMFD